MVRSLFCHCRVIFIAPSDILLGDQADMAANFVNLNGGKEGLHGCGKLSAYLL